MRDDGAADAPLHAEHDGTTYRFCSEHARARFVADPAAVLLDTTDTTTTVAMTAATTATTATAPPCWTRSAR